MFALAAGGLGVVGGIVWLILFLLQPHRPGLITIAAKPQYADQLDVPYDPYGWLGAKRLIAWGKSGEGHRQAPKVLAVEPEWVDDWDRWVDKLRGEKVDPVVIYVGLHGGVGPDGTPVLYTGRNPRANEGPATVSLTELIDRLAAVNKRKVLVLDVARGLPDPTLGEVDLDFVRAVKSDAMRAKIRGTPDLLVICGADDGQRGWESADLGMTALAYQLMKGLSGAAAPPDMRSFTAADLFAYVRREVGEWAKNNRPAAQEPLILPDPAEDNRATAGYDQRKFLVPDARPADVGAPAAARPEKARERWDKCAELARLVPGPATYTPLTWRRYRELLFRYEAAALAGDDEGLGVLGNAIDQAVGRIEAGLRLDLTSAGWTLPLPAAAGKAAPDSLSDALWRATDQTAPPELRAAADKVAGLVRTRPQRPTEAQFLLMTDHFHSKVLARAGGPVGRPVEAGRPDSYGGRTGGGRRPPGRGVVPVQRVRLAAGPDRGARHGRRPPAGRGRAVRRGRRRPELPQGVPGRVRRRREGVRRRPGRGEARAGRTTRGTSCSPSCRSSPAGSPRPMSRPTSTGRPSSCGPGGTTSRRNSTPWRPRRFCPRLPTGRSGPNGRPPLPPD